VTLTRSSLRTPPENPVKIPSLGSDLTWADDESTFSATEQDHDTPSDTQYDQGFSSAPLTITGQNALIRDLGSDSSGSSPGGGAKKALTSGL
jgi:hypothetical protein